MVRSSPVRSRPAKSTAPEEPPSELMAKSELPRSGPGFCTPAFAQPATKTNATSHFISAHSDIAAKTEHWITGRRRPKTEIQAGAIEVVAVAAHLPAHGIDAVVDAGKARGAVGERGACGAVEPAADGLAIGELGNAR